MPEISQDLIGNFNYCNVPNEYYNINSDNPGIAVWKYWHEKFFIDSIIAPSALNETFFNDINSLAPFGSGNSEPKFVIENLQVVASDIIANKHIKTVLHAKDGSTIKGIAFNAKDSPLEPYLNKKNKKNFNIAGKMSLNEWRGRKNIEFIIEDVSLN